jgi:dTDP-4-amino-4,6-dideoxy-D-galactose acyltransferase
MSLQTFNKISLLDWDSEFFGYNVAQVRFNQAGYTELLNLLKEIKDKKIRLTYFFVSPDNIDLNRTIADTGAVLVDQKVLFEKTTHKNTVKNSNIIEYKDTQPNEKLIELGLQAGAYSRFLTDKNFHNNEFEKLYKQWIVNSVNRTIAWSIPVAMSGSAIVGLITLGKKDNYADIGLIAVDKKYEGRGIGSDLIRFAENRAYEMNYSGIKVVTQLQNTRACRLYEKCNFTVENVTNIYHFWQ